MGATSRATSRFASLDGLRALSIALVIQSHTAFMAGAPVMSRRLVDVMHTGALGVRVFFAISGFLITALLLQELESTGRISLRRFYFRRTLRILPPFFVFFGLMLVAWALGAVRLTSIEAWHAGTLTTNWSGHGESWVLAHTWSLSIEEQFYLIWPGLLVAFGIAGGRRALIGVVVLAVAWRFALYRGWQVAGPMEEYTFHNVADWLAAGALLAIFRSRLHANALYTRALAHPLTPIVLGLGIVACWTGLGYWRRSLIMLPGAVFGVALLLDWAMTHPTHVLARPLNWAPIAWVGRLSYSLYLWQQPFLDEKGTAWWNTHPLALPCALGAAVASYYLVERPALDWRARIEPTLSWLNSRRSAA